MTQLTELNVKISGDSGGVSAAVRTANDALTSFGKVTDAAEFKLRNLDRGLAKSARTISAVQARINSATGVMNKLSSSASRSASAFAEFDRMSNSIDNLRSSYDPAFAASQRYEAAVRQLDAALEAGVITQQKYNLVLKQAQVAHLGPVSAAKGLGGSLGKLGNVSSQTRAQIQNTSFQLQDMAVQMQMGTRTSVILGQQLPQLLGGFGALGAVLGVVAGVGIPALAFAFSSLGGDIDEADEATETFIASLDAATSAFNRALIPVGDLTDEFGRYSDAVSRASYVSARASLALGMEGFAGAVSAIEAPLANVQVKLAQYTEAIRNANTAQTTLGERTVRNASAFDEQDAKVAAAAAELQAAADEMGMTSAQATKLSIELQRLSEAEGMQAVADQSAVVLDLFDKIFPATKKIPLEVANIVTELEAVLRAAAAGVTAFEEMGAAAAKVNIGTPLFQQGFSPQGLLPPQTIGGGNGGGGGQREDPLKGELDRLKESLLSQEELELASYNRRKEVLREALEKKYLDEVEFKALTEEEAARHNDAMEQLDRQRQKAALQGFSGMFGDLASLMQSSNDKLFKIGKAAAIAEAVVNGYSAAVAAWEKGMKIGGPPVAAAFTGASLAKTGALISSINSTSKSGGGGGASGAVGGASGTSGAVAQAPAQTSSNVAISLTGGDMFSRDQVIQLINGINDAVDDGAQIRLV